VNFGDIPACWGYLDDDGYRDVRMFGIGGVDDCDLRTPSGEHCGAGACSLCTVMKNGGGVRTVVDGRDDRDANR